jgi:hypothetical protein
MTRFVSALVAVLAFVASPASAEFRRDLQLTLAPGATFMLDSDTGSVTISGDMTSGASVSIVSRDDEFEQHYTIEMTDGRDGAVVRIRRRTGWARSWLRGWNDNTRIVVRVPRATSSTVRTAGGSIQASRLGNVDLRTSGGSVTADGLEGRADIRTSGGSISARSIRGDVDASTSGGSVSVAGAGGRVDIETSGGGITVDAAGGDISASTSGGGIRIRDAAGHVEAHTSGGPIDVAFLAGNGRGGDLSTSGGGISVTLDPSVGLSLDVTASGGGVQADVPVTVRGTISRQALRGELNGGGPLLRIRTSGGGVRLSPGATRR